MVIIVVLLLLMLHALPRPKLVPPPLSDLFVSRFMGPERLKVSGRNVESWLRLLNLNRSWLPQ